MLEELIDENNPEDEWKITILRDFLKEFANEEGEIEFYVWW